MFGIFTQGLQKALNFATGRGATALATGIFAAMAAERGSITLPAIGLAVSIPVTVLVSTMEHRQLERRITNRYRGEIAAILGISPREVTLDHMRLAAKGDPAINLPGNRTLDEALTRNDRHRMISIIANVLSAGITIAAVFSGPALLPLVGLSDAAIATTVWLGAMVTSFCLDVAIKHFGQALFGYDNHPSLDDRIEGLAQARRRGHSLGIEQVTALVVDGNPRLAQEIEAKYGVGFAGLPANIRADVIRQYDAAYELSNTVNAINIGRLPVSELAFTVEGVRSGAFPPPGAIVSGYQQELAAKSAAPIHHYIPGIQQARQFVQRVRPHVATGASHAERLAESTLSDFSSKAIH